MTHSKGPAFAHATRGDDGRHCLNFPTDLSMPSAAGDRSAHSYVDASGSGGEHDPVRRPDPNGIMEATQYTSPTNTAGCSGKIKQRFHIPKCAFRKAGQGFR